MKKNLISIIILALLIVNVVLSAIMIFSVVGTSRKTAALVDNIATALNLELTAGSTGQGIPAAAVPLSDTALYDISEKMTIPLKVETDENGNESQHYFIANITLSMNTKGDGYKDYGESMESMESLVKSEIADVIQSYTIDEARNNQEQMKQEILDRLHRLFDSDFIFNVSFSDTMVQ